MFGATGLAGAAPSLLEDHPLSGTVHLSSWSSLSSVNTARNTDNPWTMKGTLTVASPGYSASTGLYSWTGPYSITVTQPAPDIDIKHAVFQLDLVWDPASGFPANGGPKLNYNGGTQRLTPMPMLLGRSYAIDNGTGIPEMGGIDAFIYRGVTWQWDLSAVAEEIHSISVVMPFANHTAVSGARIDVASNFSAIQGQGVTAHGLWRETYFGNAANTGNAADGADPDGDGMSNLIEYALGTHPNSKAGVNGQESAPFIQMIDNRLKLAFKIPGTPPSEITYKVRVTEDLVIWKTLATKVGTAAWVWSGDGASQMSAIPSFDRTQVIIGDEFYISDKPKRLMRLEISY